MTDDVNAHPEEQGSGFRFRDTTRAPFTTDVRLRFDRLGGAVSAETADISMEGMFVKTGEPRPVGTLVQFEFDLDQGETVQGLGDVVWVRARGSENKPAGMGIQFRYVDPKSREHVFKIVSSFISQISGSEAMPSIPTDGPPEESPISTGTVAVPLSSLPGLGLEDSTEGSSTSPQSEYEAGLHLTPPPPPPATSAEDGPFGGLLGRGREVETEVRSETSKNPMSGSFSLSVPRPETARSAVDDGLPALNDAPDFLSPSRLDESESSSAAEELASTIDYATSSSQADAASAPSEAPAGGVASEPLLASSGVFDPGPAASEPAFEDAETSRPSLFDAPRAEPAPVEPYVPPSEAGEFYGGGSARAAGGFRTSLLLVGLLLVAAAAALYVYRPWETLLGRPSPADDSAVTEVAEPSNEGPDASTDQPAEAPFPESTGPRVGFSADTEDPEIVDPSAEDGRAADSEDQAAVDPADVISSSPPPTPASARNWPRDGRLGGLETISGSGQTLVRITADRPLTSSDFEAVSLSGPPRYLVKIRGLDALYSGGIEGLIFRGLRSGVHQVDGRSELHLVFDMTSSGFEADAELANGEILVTFR